MKKLFLVMLVLNAVLSAVEGAVSTGGRKDNVRQEKITFPTENSRYFVGNGNLTLFFDDNGGLTAIRNRKGTLVKGYFKKYGKIFKVTLLENVYGLDDGKRTVVPLKIVKQKGNEITIAPSKGKLPEFTFRTIDKGNYFVFKLIAMKNPDNKHGVELSMENVGFEWLPLDSVTKKTYRRRDRPSFFGIFQRSKKNPLGSIAVWSSIDDDDHDEILYKIWTTEDIPHPKVDGEWTVEKAKEWNAWFAREIYNGHKNMMIIGPQKPEDLKSLVGVAEKFGIKDVYMHLNTWGGRYWPVDKDNLEVNRKVFPNGLADMIRFSDYLHANGMAFTFRTVSYALTPRHPQYLAKGHVDPRLASWWRGTLAEDIDTETKTIKVAEGREYMTEYDSQNGKGVFDRHCMQIGNELVVFKNYSSNGDGIWTLHGCNRGYAGSELKAHRRGEKAKGLYRVYGVAMAPDPDSTMLDEMARKFAEFHNKVHADMINWDAMEVHEMMYYYGDTKFTGETYRYIDHPIKGTTSGPSLTWGYYEPMFRSVRKSASKCEVPVPRTIPYAHDMKIGLHQSHWSASSPYAYVWAIPGNAAAGRSLDLSAQAGFHDVTMEMLQKHGLIDYYSRVFKQWSTYGFLLPVEIKKRIFASFQPNDRYSLIDEVFRIEEERGSLSVVPFRVMKRKGIDRAWCYHQEHGTIYPYQYIRSGEVLADMENPYDSQVPEFIVRVMSDFHRDLSSLRCRSRHESKEEKAFNDMLDKFQGASGVTLEENVQSLTNSDVSLKIMPELSQIKNNGIMSFKKKGNVIDICCTNNTDKQLKLIDNRYENLSTYRVKTDITHAGGLGVVVTGDGSGALLIIRISGQGTRDYLIHLDFKGKRYIEIASPQVAWVDARWTFVNAYKRWRGNQINRIGIGIDRVKANSKVSVQIEDLRFLPEKPSALINPRIKLSDGSIDIRGTVPSDHYLWYRGGDKVSVYDLNWNKLKELPVKLSGAGVRSGKNRISVTNHNGKSSPWLEVQFFVKDKPMFFRGAVK